MSTTQEPDCGSSSCIFSAKGGMRTNGPCRCYENAGFHGSAVMAARQMLPELLKLRAAHAWIKTSERIPADDARFLAVVADNKGTEQVEIVEFLSRGPAFLFADGNETKIVTWWMPLPEPPK